MRGMGSAKEYTTAPPGRYRVRITSAEVGVAKSSGNPKIALTGEIIEPEQYAGATFFDTIITDGTAKGAGFSKKKLRGLGIAEADSDADVPDEQIAVQLTGVETWAELDNDPRMKENPATGKYDVPVTQVVDGKQVPVMNITVSAYLGSLDTTSASTAPAAPAETTTPAPDKVPATAAPAATAQAATPPWKKKVVAGAPAPAAK